MKISSGPPKYAMLPLRLLNASAAMIETLVPLAHRLPKEFRLMDFEGRFRVGGLVQRTFYREGTKRFGEEITILEDEIAHRGAGLQPEFFEAHWWENCRARGVALDGFEAGLPLVARYFVAPPTDGIASSLRMPGGEPILDALTTAINASGPSYVALLTIGLPLHSLDKLTSKLSVLRCHFSLQTVLADSMSSRTIGYPDTFLTLMEYLPTNLRAS